MRYMIAACLSLISLLPITSKSVFAAENGVNVEDQIRLFMGIPIGVSQRDFRLNVPASWENRPSMYSMKQNQNPRGEINIGWFQYEFQANGDGNIQMDFTFWNSRLASSRIDDTTFDTPSSDKMLAVAAQMAKVLTQKYGDPASEKIDASRRVMEWHNQGITVILSAFRKNPNSDSSVGSIGININDDAAFKAESQWSRRLPDIPPATGPLSLLTCKTQAGSGWISFDTVIDTRKLSKERADGVRKSKIAEFAKTGWICDGKTGLDADLESMLVPLERTKRHVLSTYLIFTDRGGLTNFIELANVDVGLQDKVCDRFLSIFASGASDATCVSGTAVSFRAK